MSFGETIAPIFGRWILSWFFLSEAYTYADDWDGTVSLLALQGAPAPPVFLFLSLIFVVLGALSLLIGFRTRLGAMALFLYSVMITIIMHHYWTISDTVARAQDFQFFARNIAIAGGLLVIVGIGPGRFAMENIKSKR